MPNILTIPAQNNIRLKSNNFHLFILYGIQNGEGIRRRRRTWIVELISPAILPKSDSAAPSDTNCRVEFLSWCFGKCPRAVILSQTLSRCPCRLIHLGRILMSCSLLLPTVSSALPSPVSSPSLKSVLVRSSFRQGHLLFSIPVMDQDFVGVT